MNANVNRYTPLHLAVSPGHAEGVKVLLSCRRLQANALTPEGESALTLARTHGHRETENILLSYRDFPYAFTGYLPDLSLSSQLPR